MRALARPALEQLALGINPIAVRKAERESTIGRAWAKYFATVVKGRRSAVKVERVYKKDLAPWAGKPMGELRRDDVEKLLNQIAGCPAPVQAQRVLELFSRFARSPFRFPREACVLFRRV